MEEEHSVRRDEKEQKLILYWKKSSFQNRDVQPPRGVINPSRYPLQLDPGSETSGVICFGVWGVFWFLLFGFYF